MLPDARGPPESRRPVLPSLRRCGSLILPTLSRPPAPALPPAHAPDLLSQPQFVTCLGVPAPGKFALDAQSICLRRRVLVEEDDGVVGPGLVRHGPNRQAGS